MKKVLILFVLAIFFVGCKSENKRSENTSFEKIEQLNWLVGTWTNKSGNEFSQETWSKENDSAYVAFSFTQIADSTVFAETMALEQKKNNLLLTVATKGERLQNAVTFKLISSEAGKFIFENKENDFPSRITYTNPVKDSLHAIIEGTLNGEQKIMDFYFSKQ